MRQVSRPAAALAIGGGLAALVTAGLASAAFVGAVAAEPVIEVAATIEDLFPVEQIDPRIFRRYDFSIGDSVSVEVLRRQSVKKIARGVQSTVSVVTTPSGTYSSDALGSPNVLYPGIERSPRMGTDLDFSKGGSWVSYSEGSFTYLVFRLPAARI